MVGNAKPKTTEVEKTAKNLRRTLQKVEELAGIADAAWIVPKQADISRFFGVSIDTVKNWAKRGMPGKPNAYRLDKIVQWLRQEGPWRQHITDDEDLAGGDSAQLERLRGYKADMAQMERDTMRKELHPRDVVRDMLARIASRFKLVGETITKRYGNEAGLIIRESLIESQRDVNETIGGNGHFHSEPDRPSDAT